MAGNYANALTAISCTGVGEDIVAGAVAAKIVTRVTDGMPLAQATDKTLAEMKPYDGFAGVIGITADGDTYHADTHPYMVWALYDGDVKVFD